MSWANALVEYAKTANPSSLGTSVHLTHDEKTLTIFDKFPKAKYHFLILPRFPLTLDTNTSNVDVPLSALDNLSALSKSKYCLQVLKLLQKASEEVLELIQMEMLEEHGREWPVHLGFHAHESMKHVHLHAISGDLFSDCLKNKKHYNSFHPELGFFLHLSDVIQWGEAGTLQSRIPSSIAADKLLKEPLVSHHNGKEYSNIPKLKEHLAQVFAEEDRKAKKKREMDENAEGEASSKKSKA